MSLLAVWPTREAIWDMALMPTIPLIARLVWFAKLPAKSSVLIWFAGIRESVIKNCVHWSRRSNYTCRGRKLVARWSC